MSNKTLVICLHPYSNKGGATNKIAQLLNKIENKKFEIVYIYLKKNSKLRLNPNIKIIKLALFKFNLFGKKLINEY